MGKTKKIFISVLVMAVITSVMSCWNNEIIHFEDELTQSEEVNGKQDLVDVPLIEITFYGASSADASSGLTDDGITRFTPLNANERLGFTQQSGEATFYAVNNNDVEDFSILFTWKRVLWSSIQFSRDFKKGIFLEINNIIEHGVVTARLRYLYKVNGVTGEVTRRQLTIIGDEPVRVSNDGRFVSFLQGWQRFDNSINIYLFDIKKDAIVAEFIWHPWENIDDAPRLMSQVGRINGWSLFRFDNIFKIYAEIAGGIIAWAVLDPIALTLEPLCDNPLRFFESTDGHYSLENPIWFDDVAFGAGNLDSILQR